MDLRGEIVTHKVFGAGQITRFANNYITVLFEENDSEKEFVYPSAFGSFLVMKSDSFHDQIELDISLLAHQVTKTNQIVNKDRNLIKPLKAKKEKAKPKKIVVVKPHD